PPTQNRRTNERGNHMTDATYDIEALFTEAERLAQFSRDTSTKVGAVLLDSDGDAITGGWNDLPAKVTDTPERRERPMKYKFVVHAESNAICRAAHDGSFTYGGTIVTTHHPCSDCAKLIIQ